MTNKSVAEVEYVHVLGLRESKDININPSRTIFGDPSRPYDAAFAAAGLPLLGRIQMAESIDRSRYDGLNVSYRKRMSRRFTVNTSYVFSKGVSYNGPAGDFYNRPSDLRNIFGPQDFGPTPTDEHHRLVLSGLVELPWGIKVAPIMQWASARPYTVFQGRSDLFGFGSGRGNTHVILLKDQLHNFLATKDYSVDQLRSCLADGSCVQGTFDNARGQVFYQLDTRFSKEFVLRERERLELIFQVFDFTNRANFGSNYQNSVRSSDFGKPIGFITPSGVVVPRSFSGEVGARFSF